MPDPSALNTKARVWHWLDTHPTLPFKELRAEFPGIKRGYLDTLKSNWKASKIRAEKEAKKSRGGKRSHLVSNTKQVTNPAPPPNSSNPPPQNLDPSKREFWIKTLQGAFDSGDWQAVIALGKQMNAIPTITAEDPTGLTETELNERAKRTLVDHGREFVT